ncbi:hypothetical protein J4226_00460 [Candidatus Pacearchaeota archaeon]|nr:hypothetical protein [Candidatus Pacearchaeota archaeon]
MAKKKIAKKTEIKPSPVCSTDETCYCKGIIALIIIALTWWKPVEMWANITITVLAAIILLSGNSCCCKK